MDWCKIAIRESISDLATMQPSGIGSSNAPWGICASAPDFEPSLVVPCVQVVVWEGS